MCKQIFLAKLLESDFLGRGIQSTKVILGYFIKNVY